MVATGFVSSGDIVMLDNAPIHVAGDTLEGMHAFVDRGKTCFPTQVSTHQSAMRGKIIQTDDELIFFLVNECSRSSRITSMNKQITSENILKTVSEC